MASTQRASGVPVSSLNSRAALARNAAWNGTLDASLALVNAEGALNPDGEGIVDKALVIVGRLSLAVLHPLRELLTKALVMLYPTRHRAQCLADDMFSPDIGAKDLRGHARDASLAFGVTPLTGQRRRGSHTLQRARSQAIAHAADQERHISSLAT